MLKTLTRRGTLPRFYAKIPGTAGCKIAKLSCGSLPFEKKQIFADLFVRCLTAVWRNSSIRRKPSFQNSEKYSRRALNSHMTFLGITFFNTEMKSKSGNYRNHYTTV